jgi:glycosyltransferase involved in cell wall biosynthesis
MLAINSVDQPGGAEIGLQRLVERLPHWDVTLTSPHGDEPLPLGHIRAGGGARAVLSWGKAARLARRHDVAYLNGTVAGRAIPAVKGRAKKIVLHVHDLVEKRGRYWEHADVILADSEAVADRLGDLPAHVVHCPVDLRAPSTDAPWDATGPVIGYVGRIEPRKGVLDLVRAAPAIRAAAPGARIVLVGDDTYGSDPEYARLVAASTEVEHHGWVADAAGLMAHLDVLVLPSYAEPFGTVLAEAMAAGTPVVATTVGGLPEVVTDGVDGVLVPPGRPDALADGVLRALDARDELGPRAAESARRFDADAYARRVESLIVP